MGHPLEDVLSEAELSPYLDWSDGDRALACELRELNSLVSASLFIVFEPLETTLSDKMHVVISGLHGERWFDGPGVSLSEHQRRQIADARAELYEDEEPQTVENIVTYLPFGFWAAMLSPKQEELWRTDLHRIANTLDELSREDAFRLLAPLVMLRDDIWRHRPILHRDLSRDHADIVRLARWLSPAAADRCLLGDFEKYRCDERLALVSRRTASDATP